MNIVLQRLAVFLIVAVIQRSFLDVLWPALIAPAAIIALVISLVFLFGFERGLAWSLLGVAIYALLGPPTLFPVAAVVIGYATSFLSRRIVLEAHVRSYFILAAAAGGFAFLYALSLALFRTETIVAGRLVANFFETFLLFLVLFPLLRQWERRIQYGLMSEFRGVRV